MLRLPSQEIAAAAAAGATAAGETATAGAYAQAAAEPAVAGGGVPVTAAVATDAAAVATAAQQALLNAQQALPNAQQQAGLEGQAAVPEEFLSSQLAGPMPAVDAATQAAIWAEMQRLVFNPATYNQGRRTEAVALLRTLILVLTSLVIVWDLCTYHYSLISMVLLDDSGLKHIYFYFCCCTHGLHSSQN